MPFRSIILLILMLSIALSCSKDTSQKQFPHDSLAVASRETSESSFPFLSDFSQHISESDPMNEIKTAFKILDVKILESSPQKRREQEQALENLNNAIAKIFKNDQNENLMTDILEQYKETAMYGCTNELGNCKFFDLFVTSNLSYEVLLVYLKKRPNISISEYYRVLNYSTDLSRSYSTSLASAELQLAYLRRLNEYIRFLENRREQEKISSVKRYSSALIRGNSRIYRSKEFRAFLLEIPFRELISSSEVYFRELLNSGLSIRGIFLNENGDPVNSLSDEIALFNSSLSRSMSDLKESSPTSLRFIREDVRPDNFFDNPVPSYLFFEIFHGRISDKIALKILRKDIPPEVIEKTVVSVLNWELLLTSRKANQLFKTLIASDMENRKGNLYNYLKERSNSLMSLWAREYIEKSSRLAAFIQTYQARAIRNAEVYKSIQEKFRAIPETIKFVSSYPHMMILFDEMAKIGFNMDLSSWTGVWEVNVTEIIQDYFRGRFPPLFDYGTDKRPLSPEEILQSFQLALKMGFFEQFELEPSQFAKTVITSNLYQFKERLRTDIHVIDGNLNSDLAKGIQKICGHKWPNQTNIVLRLDDLIEAPMTGEKYQTVFLSADNYRKFSGDLSGYSAQVSENIFGHSLEEELDMIRLTLDYQIFLSERMLTIVKESVGSNSYIQETEEYISDLVNIKDIFLAKLFSYMVKMSHCLIDISEKDLRLRNEMYFLEAEYLRSIHTQMKKNQQRFFNYSQLDLLKRMKARIEARYPIVYESPTELNSVSLIKSGNYSFEKIFAKNFIYSVPFDENQEIFVQKAMNRLEPRTREVTEKYMLGWIRKFEYTIKFFSRMVGASTALYKIAAAEKHYQYEAEELAHLHEKILKFINHSSTEREVYSQLKIRGRYHHYLDPYSFVHHAEDEILWDIFGKRYLKFFDYPYLLAGSDLLGTYTDLPWGTNDVQEQLKSRLSTKKLLTSYERAIEFAKGEQERPSMSVMLSEQTLRQSRDFHSTRVAREFFLVQEFESAVENLQEENLSANNPMRVQVGFNPDVILSGPYLNPLLISKRRSREETFHKDSGYYYLELIKEKLQSWSEN